MSTLNDILRELNDSVMDVRKRYPKIELELKLVKSNLPGFLPHLDLMDGEHILAAIDVSRCLTIEVLRTGMRSMRYTELIGIPARESVFMHKKPPTTTDYRLQCRN
jgi:hypothetical protein